MYLSYSKRCPVPIFLKARQKHNGLVVTQHHYCSYILINEKNPTILTFCINKEDPGKLENFRDSARLPPFQKCSHEKETNILCFNHLIKRFKMYTPEGAYLYTFRLHHRSGIHAYCISSLTAWNLQAKKNELLVQILQLLYLLNKAMIIGP